MFYPHLSLCRAYFFQAFTDENCNYFAQIENTNMIYLQKVQKCFFKFGQKLISRCMTIKNDILKFSCYKCFESYSITRTLYNNINLQLNTNPQIISYFYISCFFNYKCMYSVQCTVYMSVLL